MAKEQYRISTESGFAENETAFQDLWDRGEPHSFTGCRQVEIACRLFRQPQGGPGIVLSNGRTENMKKYQEVIFDLFNNGFQVFALDHRGQGYSGREPDLATGQHDPNWQIGDVESFNHYVDDLKQFVDTVTKAAGAEKLFLLGHSMGSAIAALYLARHADDFEAAVLVSPMHRANMGVEFLVCGGARIATAIGLGRKAFPGMPQYRKTNPAGNRLSQSAVRVRWFNQFPELEPKLKIGPASHRWLTEACRLARQFPQRAGAVKTPLLILQAGNEQIVHNDAQNIFCDAVNAETPGLCRLQPIADAKHEILMERDIYRTPAIIAILDFFNARLRESYLSPTNPA